MEVIPLTLALSLLLSLTFIALFVREFSRPRRAGAEHDSLLPLEPDLARGKTGAQPRTIVVDCSAASPSGRRHRHHGHDHTRGQDGSDACSRGVPGKPRCSDCRGGEERAARRAG